VLYEPFRLIRNSANSISLAVGRRGLSAAGDEKATDKAGGKWPSSTPATSPSTRPGSIRPRTGVLRLVLELDGEVVARVDPHMAASSRQPKS